MQKIVECVPNFSEGRDLKIINAIYDAAKSGSKPSSAKGFGRATVSGGWGFDKEGNWQWKPDD